MCQVFYSLNPFTSPKLDFNAVLIFSSLKVDIFQILQILMTSNIQISHCVSSLLSVIYTDHL